jgi:hypothetical protein
MATYGMHILASLTLWRLLSDAPFRGAGLAVSGLESRPLICRTGGSTRDAGCIGVREVHPTCAS